MARAKQLDATIVKLRNFASSFHSTRARTVHIMHHARRTVRKPADQALASLFLEIPCTSAQILTMSPAATKGMKGNIALQGRERHLPHPSQAESWFPSLNQMLAYMLGEAGTCCTNLLPVKKCNFAVGYPVAGPQRCLRALATPCHALKMLNQDLLSLLAVGLMMSVGCTGRTNPTHK